MTTESAEQTTSIGTENKTSEPQPTEPMQGAQIVREALLREGVEHIFGIPGAATVEIHQSFSETDEAEILLTRHEQGAAFAAQGYARSTGRVGVCMATSGPGATNLLTGLQGAAMDSVPLVAITGQVSTDAIGSNAFQETDMLAATREMTRRSYLVEAVAELPEIIAEAFQLARNDRPGPVLIDIPKNVQQDYARVDFSEFGRPSQAAADKPEPSQSELEAAAEAIRGAEKPVICAGGGVLAAGGSDVLREFARRLGIPVATTLKGIGAFPETDELALQLLGMHGTEYANLAVDEADLLVALGMRFSDRTTGDVEQFAENAEIIHVDIDPDELHKNKPADLAITADVGEFLRRLNDQLDTGGDYTSWRERIAGWKDQRPLRFRSSDGELKPQQVCSLVSEKAPDDSIIVTGVGQHQMWTAQYYQFQQSRTWLSSCGLGAMGFGYPAALGARVGNPDREVILFDGDGSFLMNIQELATAAQHGLPVKGIVFNNEHYGLVAQFEDFFYQGQRADTYIGEPEVDFQGVCENFQVPAERISRPEQLEVGIKQLLEARGPFVLEVCVDYEDDVLPMIPGGAGVESMISPDF